MGTVRYCLALLGATGSVGEEILRLLETRRLPLSELRVFGSDESEGTQLDFRGDVVVVESMRPARVTEADIVVCAAPGALTDLLPDLRDSDSLVVDLSGALELDPEVPLHLPGPQRTPQTGRWRAVPRGSAVGLGLTLEPLHREATLERVSAVVLESAGGAGRRGVGELSEQTIQLLNSMTGDAGDSLAFPLPLAFDCLPLVGDLLEGGETSEERRLRHVVRRLLGAPALPIEVTRIRVPIFGGSLTSVHLTSREPLSPERARALWEKQPGLEVLAEEDLPTPRSSVVSDDVLVGRIRSSGEPRTLAYATALDDLRRGAALGALEAVEALLDEAR